MIHIIALAALIGVSLNLRMPILPSVSWLTFFSLLWLLATGVSFFYWHAFQKKIVCFLLAIGFFFCGLLCIHGIILLGKYRSSG